VSHSFALGQEVLQESRLCKNFFATRTVGLRSVCTRKREWRESEKHGGRLWSWY